MIQKKIFKFIFKKKFKLAAKKFHSFVDIKPAHDNKGILNFIYKQTVNDHR